VEKDLANQAKIFGETEDRAAKQVVEIFSDLHNDVDSRLKELFIALETRATYFAKDNYRRNSSDIKRRWNQELDDFDLSGQINELASSLKDELNAQLEELQSSILEQLQFQVGIGDPQTPGDFQFDIDFEEFMRKNVKRGFKVLSGIFAVLFVVPNPIQPFALAGAMLAGFVPQVIDWLLPGAEKRRREAQTALRTQLIKYLKAPRAQVRQQFDVALKQQQSAVAAAISQGHNGNRLVLLSFRDQLDAAVDSLQTHVDALS
jgi:hypothetical protein